MNAWNGARVGWQTTNSISALMPTRNVPFGDWQTRVNRYDIAIAYENNTIYDDLLAAAFTLRQEERLYKFIRGIKNPVKQENVLLQSYTYKGTIDTEAFKIGALPIRFENDTLLEPTKQVVKWSNLDQLLAPYVHDAALLGDAAIWICDDPVRQRVRLELLDPAYIKYIERDEVGNVKSVVIEYQYQEQPDVELYKPSMGGAFQLQTARLYTKTIKVTGDSFQTFRDGKPWGFYADVNGNLVPEWDNIYGFVPLKIGHYARGKDDWGVNSFFGTARRLIDEVNDQASIIHDSIRNVVVPLLQAKGVSSSSEITISRENRDGVAIAYLPSPEAALEPVSIPLDLAGANAIMTGRGNDLEKVMPVLALQRIRDIGGNLSGVAIQNMFGDATSQIENLRKQLDPVLIGAIQMAITIGGIRHYNGFNGFNVSSYDAGDMEMSIMPRPVIEDNLSRSEKVDKLVTISTLPVGTKRKALQEMGYSEDEIDEMIEDDQAEKEQNVRDAMRGFAEGTFGADGEDTADGTDTQDTQEYPPTETQKEADARTPIAA